MASFKRGDFIKYKSYNKENITFGIFEGEDISFSSFSKRFTLALFYESKKYAYNPNPPYGYEYHEDLNIASPSKRCAKECDTLEEDAWWSFCTEEEIKQALETLEKLHYHWDKKNLTLTNTETNEVVYKIYVPLPPTYDGKVIKPTAKGIKGKLKAAVNGNNKGSSYGGGAYDHNNFYR